MPRRAMEMAMGNVGHKVHFESLGTKVFRKVVLSWDSKTVGF